VPPDARKRRGGSRGGRRDGFVGVQRHDLNLPLKQRLEAPRPHLLIRPHL
jgi:hypothetical protein